MSKEICSACRPILAKHQARVSLALFALIFLSALIYPGCRPTDSSTRKQAVRVDTTELCSQTVLDVSKIYVVTGRLQEMDRGMNTKSAPYASVLLVTHVDDMALDLPISFLADNIPAEMRTGQEADLFVVPRLHSIGNQTPSDYAAQFPIPPLPQSNGAFFTSLDGIPFRLELRLHVLGMFDSDPFNGGEPPLGEQWILPANFEGAPMSGR